MKRSIFIAGTIPGRALRTGLLIGVLLIAAGCGGQSSQQVDPQTFYKNNVLHIVVGFNPGGGFDEYARMVGAALEKRTGGTVVVDNEPGGGGLLALNRLVQGKSDGLTIMLVGGESAALAQITDRPGTRFDINQLKWLGRVQKDTPVMLWTATKPERTFAEVLKTMRTRGAVWGATGLTDNISDAEAAIGQALGLDEKQMGIVTGYSGSSETALAAVRGEVDGLVVSNTSAANYVGEGGLIPVVTLDHERDAFFPDVPTLYEAVDLGKEGKWWADFRSSITALGRSFVTRVDVDAGRVAYLRSALESVLTDKDFIAAAKARNRPVHYLPGEEQEKLARDIIGGLSSERRQEVKHVLTEKYIR